MEKDIDLSLVGSEVRIISAIHAWGGKIGRIIGAEDWGRAYGHVFLIEIFVNGRPLVCRALRYEIEIMKESPD
jgi:phage gpG-like protein